MMKSKQMDCEINLHQFSFNRLLKIAESAAPPETDLGNIQLAVLHLLDVDPELKALTSNLFNLGFDISAFNTQRRVWDVLTVDSPVYLPNRARVKVTLKTKEKVVLASPVASRRRRDPRRKTPGTIFQRDPRRKPGRVENPLLKENDQPDAVEEEEPNHNDKEGNRSDEPGQRVKEDDSREKEKIDEPQTEIVDNDVVEEEESAQPESQLQILKALPLPREPETEEQAKKVVCIKLDSESSDEERLHIAIDESFEEDVLLEPAPTTKGGLVEYQTTVEELCDVRSGAGNNGKTIGAGAAVESKKEEEEEVVIVAEKKQPQKYQLLLKTPALAEKSREQLEVEKQLLMKLVEEREMLKATLEEAGIPLHQLQINFDEVEEGELSVSYDEDVGQDKDGPSSTLSHPTKAVSEGIDLPEPIENRFKKYWDDFPDDDWQPKC